MADEHICCECGSDNRQLSRPYVCGSLSVAIAFSVLMEIRSLTWTQGLSTSLCIAT